jgi:hypothetical protein
MMTFALMLTIFRIHTENSEVAKAGVAQMA